MNEEMIFAAIKKNLEIVVGVDDLQIDNNTSIESLAINSISYIRFLVQIENELNIEFDDNDLVSENYIVVQDLINTIRKMV